MPKATAKQSIKFSRCLGLTTMPSLEGIEAAAQTWKQGAPLIFTAGSLVAAAETQVTLLAGIALANASGVTGRRANFCPVMPGTIFEAEFSDLTDGLNTPAQSIVGEDFGINITTDGKWFIDGDEAAAELVATVIGFKDTVGINNPIVFFIFKNSTTLFN
jgi:hypothetical protein